MSWTFPVNVRENSGKCPGKFQNFFGTVPGSFPENSRGQLETRTIRNLSTVASAEDMLQRWPGGRHKEDRPTRPDKPSWHDQSTVYFLVQEFSRNFVEMSRKCPWIFTECFWIFYGNFLDISRTRPGHFLEIFRKCPVNLGHTGNELVDFKLRSPTRTNSTFLTSRKRETRKQSKVSCSLHGISLSGPFTVLCLQVYNM